MKPPTVFLGEMTNPEVDAFLKDHDTVIVPTGSTEQHGPHGPLLTDAIVPTEVGRRVAVIGAGGIGVQIDVDPVSFVSTVNARRGVFQVDWFNVFNNQRAIRQDETFQINSGAPGIPPVPNPFYGTGTIFQFPSALRLGVKFQF